MGRENLTLNLTKKSKITLATIGDIFIVLILSVVIFSTIGLKIFSSIPSFSQGIERFNKYNEQASDLYYQSKLGKKGENDTDLTNTEIASINLKFYVNEDYYDKNQQYNDSLLYFYAVFSENRDLKIGQDSIAKTVSEVNADIYQFSTLSYDLWDPSSDINKPLVLSSNASSLLKDYLNGDITAENRSLYNNFLQLIVSGLDKADKNLVDSNLYQSYYQQGKNEYLHLLNFYSVGSILTLLIVYLALNVLVPDLSKNNQTIMRRLMKIKISDAYGNKPKRCQSLTSSILTFILYLPLTLIVIIPPLGDMFIYAPLFYVNGQPVYFMYVILPFFILQVGSIISFFISKHSQHFIDKIFSLYKINFEDEQEEKEDKYEKRILEGK